MVYTVKWDQVISKDGEFFLEKVNQNAFKKKYAAPGGGLQCDPSLENLKEIQDFNNEIKWKNGCVRGM